ncbi:MAG: AAA family ATPase [Planctomycetes bacterium]|nr:AAA family ATPase [Planctomycetota bacterium]
MVARLDHVSDEARALGAVNTIVRVDERWHGENYDAAGFVDALAAGPELRGASAIVLGAGGAARAVAFALRRNGARVVVGSRTDARSQSVAGDLGVDSCAWDALPLESADLVVNATPLGMWPHVESSPIDVARLRPGAWVVDTIYNPVETRLLRDARARGLHVKSGLEMFVGQAARQFRLFTGCEPDVARMRDTCRQRLVKRNVVLVGLRGSGKSTVGRIVAESRGVAFVDLDDEIANDAGMTIAQIFAREGEPAFRDREYHALERVLAHDGQVIAAGGGVVLDERNRRLLVDRATCVYLEAAADVLHRRLAPTFESDPQRPSLTGLPLQGEIEKLERDRGGLYRSVAQFVVTAGDGTPEEVAARVAIAVGAVEG